MSQIRHNHSASQVHVPVESVQILLTLIRWLLAGTPVFERDMLCLSFKAEMPPVKCFAFPNLEAQHH